MAASIGSLLINLAMNTAAFASDLGKSTSAINSWAASSNRAVASVVTSFRVAQEELASFTEEALTFKGVMLGLVGAGVIGEFVKSNLESATALVKQADAIGISTDTLQEYQYVAKVSGVSTETLNTALTKFAKNVGDVHAGTGTLSTFLQKTNVSLLDQVSAAKTTDEALNDVFNTMAKYSSQTDRLALAQAAFSRGGLGMVNVVRDGIAVFDELKDKAVSLGAVVDGNLLRSAEAAQERIDGLSSVLKAKLMVAVIQNADAIANFVDGLVTAGTWLVQAVGWLWNWAKAFGTSGVAILQLTALLDTFVTDVTVGFVQLGGVVEAFVLGLVAAMGQAGNILTDFATGLKDKVLNPFSSGDAFSALNADLKKGFSGAFKETFDQTLADSDSFGKKMTAQLTDRLSAYGAAIDKIHADQAKADATHTKSGGDGIAGYAEAMKEQADATADAADKADKAFKKLQEDAKHTYEATRTPMEQYEQQLVNITNQYQAGLISLDTYNRAVDQAGEAYKRAQDKGTLWTDIMTKAIDGQILSFKDLGKAVLQYAQQLLVALATGQGSIGKNLFSSGGGSALGGLGGLLGSLFGGGGAAAGTTQTINGAILGADGSISMAASFLHSGGMVGSRGSSSRNVHPGVFNGARRYHSGGLVSGEVPIIAQEGEQVLTKAQQQSMKQGGGNVYHIDARGADHGVVEKLQAMIVALNASIEPRSIVAVREASYRNPNLLGGR